MNKHRAFAVTVTCLLLGSAPERAAAQAEIPESLDVWRDWVLVGQEFRACPVLNGRDVNQVAGHICAWPGELEIEVDITGARFAQVWNLQIEGWIALPGDDRYWPGAVRIDGEPQAAVLRDGRPTVRVPAGEHRVTGELTWENRPASIPVPAQSGLVALSLDGAAVPLPELERGVLWLGLRPEQAVEEDSLSVNVYRLLTDSIPIRIETRVQLDVAGQSREVELDGLLLDGFIGESMSSPLPAELEADGTLRIQLRPGRWNLRVVAHHPELISELARPEPAAPWPNDEVWSFASNPALRVSVLEGAPAVDALRAGVPPEWRSLPSFAVGAETTLALSERSRNDASDSNRLTLDRYLWLDFDGEGFTTQDRVTGQLNSDWRLDMRPPYAMTMASIGAENLLVTEGQIAGTQGVELRTTSLDLLATARLPTESGLPVTGYTERFDLNRTVLFLPPAHRLLAAPGADITSGAWVDRWRLLDVFLVLIIAVASWRLLGPPGGIIALATLALTYHEPLAPHYAWLNLLLVTALLRIVPDGWLRRSCRYYRLASSAALAALLIPFMALALRTVIFPQLERSALERELTPVAAFDANTSPFYLGASIANLRGLNPALGVRTLTLIDSRRMPASDGSDGIDLNFIPTALIGRTETVTGGASATYGADAMAGVVNVAPGQQGQQALPGQDTINATGARMRRDDFAAASASAVVSAEDMQRLGVVNVADMVNQLPNNVVSRYQPGALVQTGPGLPDWGWSRYSLGFNGPIEPEQTFSLVILGPRLVGLWRTAGVGLALLLAWLLFRPDSAPTWPRPRGAGRAAVVMLCLGALTLPRPGAAQSAQGFPSPDLLNELRQRLTAPAPCHPACAELTDASVELDGASLRVELEIAVQDAVAVPMPSSPEGWRPDAIAIDGTEQRALYRDATGLTWLSIDAGVRRVRLAGPLPPSDRLTLSFPLPPRRVTVAADGWDITGVNEGRLPSGALELIRQREAQDGDDDAVQTTAFPPYVQVTRNLQFGIDWTVSTIVRRISPNAGAFTIDIDLLPEESVVSQDIEVDDGVATLAFTAGQNAVTWQSRLPIGATLSLTAGDDVPWVEIWHLDVGHEWHAEHEGLPVTSFTSSANLALVTEFQPRPGETLDLRLTRPAPVSGDTIAFDQVDYTRTVGDRSATSALELSYRSTRALEHALELPPGSELESVAIGGQTVPLELEGRTLTLPISPGRRDIRVNWRTLEDVGMRTALPAVDLGAGASNLTTRLDLPVERWILFTYGPGLGPAVLYWAELALFVLIAIALGRVSASPLKTHEWLLLGLGLSTFSWPVLALFAIWAFVLRWRSRVALATRPLLFNSMQIALGALTVLMLVALLSSIANGLLGAPAMHIVSPVPGGDLSWFTDRITGATPTAGAISVPLWWYKAAMLTWALWLSFALLRWLHWAWQAMGVAGFWRSRRVAGAPA